MRYIPGSNGSMKILLIIYSILIINNFSLAQVPEYLWSTKGGSSGYDASTNLAIDNSGNIIIAGHFDSTITFGSSSLISAGSSDIFIVKYDQEGNVIWARKAGGTDYDAAYSVAVDNLGNILITGEFSRSITFGSTVLTGLGGADIFVAKFSAAGAPIWAVKAGGQSNETAFDIITDQLNNVIITGTYQNFATFETIDLIGSSYSDFFIAKYNSSGNIQWAKSAGGESNTFNYYQGAGLAADIQNNIFVTGSFVDTMSFIPGNSSDDLISQGSDDIFVAKYNSNGSLIWARRAGGSAYDIGSDIIINKNNNILVTGTISDLAAFGNINIQSFGYSDIFIAEYNQLGNAILVTHEGNIDSIDNYYGQKISLDSLDNISILGNIGTSEEASLIYVGRFEKDGSKVWNTIINSNSFYYDGGIGNYTNSDIIFSGVYMDSIRLGNINLTGFGESDVFLSKLQFPKLIYGENPLDFGTISVGDTLSRNAVYTNTSDVPLITVSIGLRGPDIEDYFMPIIIPETVIPPQQSRSINISFAPNSNGPKNVYLIIGSSSISTPDTLLITGIGGIPSLQFVPDSLNFDSVNIGENLSQNLGLTNSSSVTVHVNNISIAGPAANEFSITQGLPVDSVTAGQTKNLVIEFSPLQATNKTAYLVLSSDAINSPDTLILTGTGKFGSPEFTFSVDTLNFGSVDIGNFSERSLTISRPRPSDLIITDFSFSGLDNNEFKLVNAILPDTIKGTDFKNYLIRFTPINSGKKNIVLNLSNSDAANPDSVILVGTAISSIIVDVPDSTNLGQNANLNISPPSGFTFTLAQFFYRMTGETNYQQTNLVFADSFYTANIPASFSTERGIQYYIIFSDGENTITFPTEDPINNPAAIQIKIPQYFYPINIKKSVYEMISIPLAIPSSSIDSIFADDYGIYDEKTWRLFSWESSTDSYLEYSNISGGLVPGNAYWLINKDGKSFDMDNALSISANSSFLIRLQSGWNQIGSPFSFPIAWDSIGNSNLILNRPQRWNSDIENYEIDQQILLPWAGYWVFNDGEPVNLSVKPLAAQIPEKINEYENISNDEFILQIKAYSNTNIQDPSNYIGMLKGGSNNFDKYDILEPPPITNKLKLSIIAENKEYAKNVVSTSGDGAFWDIKIHSKLYDKNINISLIKRSSLPSGFKVWFLDLNRMVMLTIVEEEIGFNLPEEGEGMYRIIVGNENFAENNSKNIPLIPLEYELSQNYPNPFNPITNIAYKLKEKSNVKLDIFNSLGEKIITLINDEIQNPGLHNIIWNGVNYFGEKVASGIYIYRITANDFIQSKKMVLLK